MTATLTLLGLQFLWSFIVSSIVWSLLFLVFGDIIKPLNTLLQVGILTLITFGLSFLFDITEGIVFIWNSGMMALLNQSFNLFGIAAIAALTGVIAMLVSATAVFIARATED